MKNEKNNNYKAEFHFSDKLWDLWCIASVIGIWPRFVEPNLLITTKLSLPIPNLPKQLKGLKILQFTDLHLNRRVPDRFLTKLLQRIEKYTPDIVVFTGDFLCYSNLDEGKRLKRFLNEIQAPLGCYAIFGNHDYERSVSVNEEGDYDIIDQDSALIAKGFKRLVNPIPLTGKATSKASSLQEHQQLRYLLNETPFQLLNNSSKTLKIGGAYLNICGVGEHMLARCDPQAAFKDYNKDYPGIILAHNPDCIPALENYPGDVILCGHTHGAQVNLPWIWKNFVILENMQYKRGLFKVKEKWIYVNRGVGSAMPFRWFSLPEILLLTLE